MIPEGQNREKIAQQNQEEAEAMSRDESPAFVVRNSEWMACNEITDKLQHGGRAIAWAMKVDGHGWFGRVGKRMSFGPTSRDRARKAVEAFIKGELFAKTTDETSWRGTCWALVSGSGDY